MHKTQAQMDQRPQHKATMNLIEEKVGSTLECIGTGDHFLNITPVAQILREKINKWDLLILKSFCKAKDMIKTKTTAYRMGKDLHQPPLLRAELQNIQRTQQIGHQKNQITQ